MAVQLFLNGHEVITDSSQEIKIIKENPYFTLSDSYTLDVSIPLDILQNRMFFGSIDRIEKTKKYHEYTCRLLHDEKLIMEGTARIVQSTDLIVKVQLTSGVSALKMSSEQEGTYIDSYDFPSAASFNIFPTELDEGLCFYNDILITGWYVPLYDNSNEAYVNIASSAGYNFMVGTNICSFYLTSDCPSLLSLAKMIAGKLGYNLDLSVLPAACSYIYVVSSIQGKIGKKLPHWTVKEFFAQFQNFFGCTFIKSGAKDLKLVSLGEFIHNDTTTIEPVSEFQVEYAEDDEIEGVMNRNIEFQMESYDREIIDKEILEQAQYNGEYANAGAMENAFREDSSDVKMHKIYKCKGEKYIGWEKEEGQYELKRIAPFNPLERFEGAESTKLKIAPAYIEENIEVTVGWSPEIGYNFQRKFNLNLPVVTNPYPLRYGINISEDTTSEHPTIQSLVEGKGSIVSDDDKSDILSVVFMDGQKENIYVPNGDGTSFQEFRFDIHLAFTDYSFKKQLTNNHKKWSFSLNPLNGYEFYLGQLHRLSFSCSHNVKHIFKFISDVIPDPTNIFIIRGKRFACEKIEASIRDGKLDNMMTGYFYEMTE